jgi:hypothetical protein
MTSRTFTQTASFPSFKKKYTASAENVLEEFYQHQSDEAKKTIAKSSVDMSHPEISPEGLR